MLQSLQEWNEINWQCWMKSTHQIIAGYDGALDGVFQCTTKPSQKELGNVIAYYSGHYKLNGLNYHACVKLIYNSYILDLCCLGLQTTSLTHWHGLKVTIDSLTLGLDGLTDAAYSLKKKLLIPFMGAHRLDSVHDVFNY